MKRILITGGAGFVGSSLALDLKASHPSSEVIAFDNLKRRGSELNVARLRLNGVVFQHGDVRSKEDILETGSPDLIIDCAAEPSVLAGTAGSPSYVIDTNLVGTINCLELARRTGATFVFLSTSRVYPIDLIESLNFEESESRYSFSKEQRTPGASNLGLSEEFPLGNTRSIYGASKLSAEFLFREYIASYGIKGFINRCGVLTGPWQMGKVDQGVVVLWIARHFFGKGLSYIGYGGSGKQARDILHVRDLSDLLRLQLAKIDLCNNQIFNVGGGNEVSVSLRELTVLSQQATGKSVKIASVKENRPNDIRAYITNNSKISSLLGWSPRTKVEDIVTEISKWITDNRIALEHILT